MYGLAFFTMLLIALIISWQFQTSQRGRKTIMILSVFWFMALILWMGANFIFFLLTMAYHYPLPAVVIFMLLIYIMGNSEIKFTRRVRHAGVDEENGGDESPGVDAEIHNRLKEKEKRGEIQDADLMN